MSVYVTDFHQWIEIVRLRSIVVCSRQLAPKRHVIKW